MKKSEFRKYVPIEKKENEMDKLQIIGDDLSIEYNCEFIFKDYRAGNGVEIQGKQVKENNLYRQNYCGCMFGLNMQREQQDKLTDELIMPIGQQIQPESIEERFVLYKKRNEIEDCTIIKQRFLNYRLLSGKVTISKKIVPSYFLCYSTLKNNKTQGRVEKTIDNIAYLNRDEVKIITLDYFNELSNKNYKNTMELIYDPLIFSDELKIRMILTNNSMYDLSTILVLDIIPDSKIEIVSDAKVFEDIKEIML
jgi:hypothetical protein